jgi:hypothetical protein
MMNPQPNIRVWLAVAGVTCLSALALLSPPAPAASAAGERGDCRLPAWTHVLTGHWGGGCR